jgi:heptosyltransferase II
MKILAVQNRMGIGDMVIFLPFIEAISKKFSTPVSILVKENSKASQFLENNKYIDKIIILDRNKSKNGSHDGLKGFFRLINELKKYNYDKVFIFNSSIRFNLISRLSSIKEIYQYPLFQKKNQHIIKTAQNFLKNKINLDIESNPKILINDSSVDRAKSEYKINKNQLNILLGIGGSGQTKRIPFEIFLKFMRLVSAKHDCKFFLATGKSKEEQIILNKILDSEFKSKIFSLDNLELKKTLPIIKNCNIAVCNDSSFSHLSSALDIETIVLMSDTPLLYGSYSPKMHPIIPDGENIVTHNTRGKNKINPNKIFEKLNNILN